MGASGGKVEGFGALGDIELQAGNLIEITEQLHSGFLRQHLSESLTMFKVIPPQQGLKLRGVRFWALHIGLRTS